MLDLVYNPTAPYLSGAFAAQGDRGHLHRRRTLAGQAEPPQALVNRLEFVPPGGKQGIILALQIGREVRSAL